MARKLNLGINNVAQTVTGGCAQVDGKTPRKALVVYVGVGGKAQRCFGVTPISFFIDEKRYVYAKGTTWETWAALNPPYAVTEDGYVSLDGGATIIYRDDTVKVLATEEIEHGVAYENNCACREWTEWTTTKYPTCVEDGEEQRTCAVCGAVQTRIIAASEEYHEYSSTTISSPTCISLGTIKHTCIYCGNTYNTNTSAMGDHSYENGICTVCGVCSHSADEVYTKIDSSYHKVSCSQCDEELRTEDHHLIYSDAGTLYCEYCGYVKSSGSSGGDGSGGDSDIHTHVWVEAYTKGGLTVYACEGCSETKQVCNHSYDAEGNCIYCSNPSP